MFLGRSGETYGRTVGDGVGCEIGAERYYQ